MRFLSEAEAVAAFQHPNIVQVFDTGQHNGLPYMALEFVTGGSLADKIKDGPLSSKEAARIVEQIARGMNAAHQGGIVHRDLKPDNVLLTEDGTPKVTDFGLAKKVEGGSGLTQTGAIMGTPSYMAPEQAGGEGKRVGPAADVYALGAVLYACLTGRPPFQGENAMNTILQVMTQDPVPPRQVQKNVPADLETICLKCLEKEPLKRYASAHDLAEDLRCWRAGDPIAARPVGHVERAVKWVRRRPVVAGLIMAVLSTTLAGIGGIIWAFSIALTNERLAKKNEETALAQKLRADQKAVEAVEQKKKTARQLLRSEWLLYAAKIREAQSEWLTNDVGAAMQRLDECRWDFRGWEHDYLWTMFNRGQHTLRVNTSGVGCIALSPDGKKIVVGCNAGLNVLDIQSGQVLQKLRGHTGLVKSVAFSPDGKKIVSGSGDRTVVIV